MRHYPPPLGERQHLCRLQHGRQRLPFGQFEILQSTTLGRPKQLKNVSHILQHVCIWIASFYATCIAARKTTNERDIHTANETNCTDLDAKDAIKPTR